MCPIVGFSQNPGAYKCLDLDGTNDYVLIKDHASLNSDSTITVEAWIKADNYGRNVFDNSIFCKHGWSRGNLGYVLRCGDGGKLSFNFADGSGTWREVSTAAVMETGIWYHVAGSYNGDSVNVYINGKLMATTLYTGSISPSSGLTARIGDLANGGGRLFDGMIDEVRVWSTALDENTLRDWMCRKLSSSHPNHSNLEGNWKLDEDAGTTASDASPESNAGTLTNGPTISLSEAVIGDSSIHTYGGTAVNLKSKYNDILEVSSITGSPSCFHIVVDYQPNPQPLAKGLSGQLDSTHHYSVFYPEDTAVKFTLSYDFGDKKGVTKADKCGIDLFTKTITATGSWSHAGAKYHQNGDSLTLSNQRQSAFGILSYPTDSNSILTSNTEKFALCGNNTLDLTAIGNDSFTYLWGQNDSFLYSVTGNTLTVDSPATYYVEITRKGTTCTFKSAKIKIARINKPTVSLSSFKGVCESVDSVLLKGGSPSGGIFSGTGVSNGYFLPSTVKQGNYDITYTYTDSNQCSNEATKPIQVYGLPSFNSSGQNSFCNDKDSVALSFITPTGGTYSGDFISNNYFHIDSANRQNKLYAYSYAYTDGNNCTNRYDDSLEIKWATPCTLSKTGQLCNQDDSVQLKGTPASGMYFGDGVSGNQFHPKIAGVGTHKVVYAFTNLLNCTTTDTQQIVVIPNGKATWSQKVLTCLNGDSIQLTGGSPTGGFYIGSGISSNGWFNPKKVVTGNHKLAYVSKDTNGCENKAWVTATVRDTTTISFSGNTAYCLFSDPILLKSGSPVGGRYDGNGVTADTLYPSIAGFGKHPIQYQYTNSNNCTSTSSITYEIFKPDSVSVIATNKLCVYSDPVVLRTYPSGGMISGKGIIGSVFSPSISGPGKHLITYSISGSQGCLARDSMWIEVGEKPEVTMQSLTSICEKDDPFVLNNGSPSGQGSYWINGINADTFQPTVLGQGQFYIEYKVVTALGCKDSTNTMLVINPNPPKPIISKSKNALISSHLNGNQWYDLSGTIDGATKQQFEASKDGMYYTIVTSDSGCSATSDTFDFMYVGISTNPVPTIKIGPNPSTRGMYHITSDQSIENVVIITVAGVRLPGHLFNKNELSIDLSLYPAGVYTLLIEQSNAIHSFRLQKI